MKIAHISDLHFGSTTLELADALKVSLAQMAPDLIIVSGDITQSARVLEFSNARTYLQDLGVPLLCVPGNHDLPALELARFINPFGRYRRAFGPDLNPQLSTPLAKIKGLNSARAILPHLNWANGAISHRQCKTMRDFFEASDTKWRLLTLHHPLYDPEEVPLNVALFNRQALLDTIGEQKIDLVLTGHQHHAYVRTITQGDHKTLFLSASTAMSWRTRIQGNGYNYLELTESEVKIKVLSFRDGTFKITNELTHSK
jgi:3',5'-cyclic AMP phosphodiesterase CpdA